MPSVIVTGVGVGPNVGKLNKEVLPGQTVSPIIGVRNLTNRSQRAQIKAGFTFQDGKRGSTYNVSTHYLTPYQGRIVANPGLLVPSKGVLRPFAEVIEGNNVVSRTIGAPVIVTRQVSRVRR